MSTRASAARHVRQRKLNTKQALRIYREHELEETLDDDAQRHIPQLETGVEKGEEGEYHLQAVINSTHAAALGSKTKQNYIPTPDAVRAKDVQYDVLYPKVFSQPATYIRFSSTVEESVGTAYCMDENDIKSLTQLNDSKACNGTDHVDDSNRCSEDTFEEVMTFFEETSARIQPFANVDHAAIPSLEELEQSIENEPISADAHKWLRTIYRYWVVKRGNRPLMPMIKVRVLDTTSEADDADPYVCFRRREVRQTRKTRGRDAQVVEKLKKLRMELESARDLVKMVVEREQLNAENIKLNRHIFDQRAELKEVKVKNSIEDNRAEDDALLVNQKPVSKPKVRQESLQQHPSLLRLGSGQRSAPDNDLLQLSDYQADNEAYVLNTIESRKAQHRKWNERWVDETVRPLTPPPENEDGENWQLLIPDDMAPLSPPATLPSEPSQDRDGDVSMTDSPLPMDAEGDASAGAEDPQSTSVFHIPDAWPTDDRACERQVPQRNNWHCHMRVGRGGRLWLVSRKPRTYSVAQGVVSDDDSEDDAGPPLYHVRENLDFEYRVLLNAKGRAESGPGVEQRRQHSVGEASAMAAAAAAAAAVRHAHAHPHPAAMQVQASAAGSG